MRWEYHVLDWELPQGFSVSEDKEYCFCRNGAPVADLAGLTRKDLEQVLDRLGAEGWELVQVYEYRKLFLKRPVAG
jgi:hypothetical protein